MNKSIKLIYVPLFVLILSWANDKVYANKPWPKRMGSGYLHNTLDVEAGVSCYTLLVPGVNAHDLIPGDLTCVKIDINRKASKSKELWPREVSGGFLFRTIDSNVGVVCYIVMLPGIRKHDLIPSDSSCVKVDMQSVR